MNREQIDEVFEAYIFNLVNSGMDIVFLPIVRMKHKKDLVVDWKAPCEHDQYIEDKLSISDEDERKIAMGIDVYDNGTYWAFPMQWEEEKNDYTLFGGTHRFFSLMKLKNLGLRDFTKKKFLCYNVADGISNIKYIENRYKDIIFGDIFQDNYLNKLEEWIDERSSYIESYYIIAKKQFDKNGTERFFKQRGIYVDLTKHLCDVVGEFGEEFYIVKSIKGLDCFNDNLVYCKNDINKINKTGNRIIPHKMIRCEEEYNKHKSKYVYEEFIKRNKDKIKLY